MADLAPIELLVQLTDLHVQAGAGDAAASERVERAFALVRALEPRPVAVLVTGDLVNSGGQAEYDRLSELLCGLEGLRVLPLVGNHDDRDRLRATFAHVPEVAALPDDAHHVQYEATVGSLRILALDSQHTGHDGGKLCDTRTAWLADQLAAAPRARTIIAMHHPPFDTGIPGLDAVRLRVDHRARLGALLAAHGGVERIVAGHVHRAVTGALAGIPAFACPSVFYPALPLLQPGPIQLVEGPVGIGAHVCMGDGALASHVRMVGAIPGVVTPIPPA